MKIQQMEFPYYYRTSKQFEGKDSLHLFFGTFDQAVKNAKKASKLLNESFWDVIDMQGDIVASGRI